MSEPVLPLIGREAVSRIVPHKRSMLLIDSVFSFKRGDLQAGALIGSSSPFSKDGKVPAYISFELIAQSISAYSYLCGIRKGEEPMIGFILKVSNFKLLRETFDVGERVVIDITEDCVMNNDIYKFIGKVSSNGGLAASGELLVISADDPEALLGGEYGI